MAVAVRNTCGIPYNNNQALQRCKISCSIFHNKKHYSTTVKTSQSTPYFRGTPSSVFNKGHLSIESSLESQDHKIYWKLLSSRDTCARAAAASSNIISSDQDHENEKDAGVIVLVIGGGGREHALCYALQKSATCDAVFCAPGNAGIADSGDATCITDLDILDSSKVISFCQTWAVGLVVVGPEAPLVSGLVNDLVKAGIPTFGSSKEAAVLEGSKDFMKKLCDKYNIPTAKGSTLNFGKEIWENHYQKVKC